MKKIGFVRILALALAVCLLWVQLPAASAAGVIEEISVSGLAAPVAGQYPDYTVDTDGEGYHIYDITENYFKNGIQWYDITDEIYMSPGDAFRSGHQYEAQILITPEYTYTLSPVHCTVDGKSAEAAIQGGQVCLIVRYVCTGKNVISVVGIKDLEPPAAGIAPDYTASTVTKGYTLSAISTDYSKNGILWYDATQEHNLATTGKFHIDHQYTVRVTLKAESGYEFDVFSDMTATVNGYPAEIFGGMDQTELVLSLDFVPCVEPEEQVIREAAIFNVTAPVAGEKAEYYANVMPISCGLMDLNGENTLHGLCWYDETAERELQIGERFIGGHTYNLTINLQAEAGYLFSPATRFLVNGADGNGFVSGGFATVTCSFECEGSTFTDVKPDAYYYNSVIWAVKEEITAGTTPTTFSPEDPCTRAQAVTFLWRFTGSPMPAAITCPFTDVSKGEYYYDAMMWAVGSKITAGTSITEFSPNQYCTRAQIVSFLWRAWGCPEPTGVNTFKDVPEDAYYHDAVLWAVERGITVGTDVGVFSPDDVCTRAQIVTFLYRCIHN